MKFPCPLGTHKQLGLMLLGKEWRLDRRKDFLSVRDEILS